MRKTFEIPYTFNLSFSSKNYVRLLMEPLYCHPSLRYVLISIELSLNIATIIFIIIQVMSRSWNLKRTDEFPSYDGVVNFTCFILDPCKAPSNLQKYRKKNSRIFNSLHYHLSVNGLSYMCSQDIQLLWKELNMYTSNLNFV